MTRKPPRGSKAEAIREYLRKNPDGTRDSFMDATGIEVISSQFSVLRRQMDEERKAHKKKKSWQEVAAETDPRRPAPPKPIIVATDDFSDLHEMNNLVLQLKDTEKKMDEYRYRCWKLEGEKFGYVQRVLEENKK